MSSVHSSAVRLHVEILVVCTRGQTRPEIEFQVSPSINQSIKFIISVAHRRLDFTINFRQLIDTLIDHAEDIQSIPPTDAVTLPSKLNLFVCLLGV